MYRDIETDDVERVDDGKETRAWKVKNVLPKLMAWVVWHCAVAIVPGR